MSEIMNHSFGYVLREARCRRRACYALLLVLALGSVGRADLLDGLVTYYPFSGNANDASGSGHDGIVYGPTLTSDRLGNVNSAYSFDGVDDYINVLYSDAFQTSDFTFSAWIRSERDYITGGRGTVVAGRGEDFTTDRAWAWLSIGAKDDKWGSGILTEYEDNGDTERVYATDIFPQNDTWTHLAATRSSDGEVTIYMDGTVIGNWASSPEPTTMCDQDLTIGARWSSSTLSGPYNLGGFFDGSLDEIRMYDRALADAEVRELARFISEYPTLDTVLSDDGGSPFLINPSLVTGLGASDASYVDLTDLTPPETSVATILLEAAGFAGSNVLGIYNCKGTGVAPTASEMLELFPGGAGAAFSASVQFDLATGLAWYDRNSNGIKDAGETAMVGDSFGFYLGSPDVYGDLSNPFFYSDALLNPDTVATEHGLIYDTRGITGAITGDPDIVVAFEDLLAGHSDWDFTDMVIGITDVAPWSGDVEPIPTPGAFVLCMVGTALVGRMRRGRES